MISMSAHTQYCVICKISRQYSLNFYMKRVKEKKSEVFYEKIGYILFN
jgi:hypothetical protein